MLAEFFIRHKEYHKHLLPYIKVILLCFSTLEDVKHFICLPNYPRTQEHQQNLKSKAFYEEPSQFPLPLSFNVYNVLFLRYKEKTWHNFIQVLLYNFCLSSAMHLGLGLRTFQSRSTPSFLQLHFSWLFSLQYIYKDKLIKGTSPEIRSDERWYVG